MASFNYATNTRQPHPIKQRLFQLPTLVNIQSMAKEIEIRPTSGIEPICLAPLDFALIKNPLPTLTSFSTRRDSVGRGVVRELAVSVSRRGDVTMGWVMKLTGVISIVHRTGVPERKLV